MRNKGLAWFCGILGLIVCLLGIFIGTTLLLENYVFVGWHFYPKEATYLDLRGDKLSAKNYNTLSARLPNCRIRWSIPIQDERFPDDSEEITIHALAEEDLDMFWYLPKLKTVHAEGCTDYAQLSALQELRSDCKVLYSVEVDGKSYDQDTRVLSLSRLTEEDITLLGYLPALETVDAYGCKEYDLLYQLQQSCPYLTVVYTVTIRGEEYSSDLEELTLENADAADLTTALQRMTNLKLLNVTEPDAEPEELLELRAQFPDVELHWTVDIFGTPVPDDTPELDLSGRFVTIREAEAMAAKLPGLEKLIMSDCGIDDETMAAFREEKRGEYKVVWTVYFSEKCKARTDDTYFMPIQQREYYFGDKKNPMNLKYCEDMVCVDVGDAPALTIADWAAYMPHLKYLILANSNVKNISALSNCKELIYLELDGCEALTDYSPLVECTALQDLNLSRSYGKADPLCEMTWLKNLWWEDASTGKQLALSAALPNTHLQFYSISTASGRGWRNLPNYYAQRDYLGMYYMD